MEPSLVPQLFGGADRKSLVSLFVYVIQILHYHMQNNIVSSGGFVLWRLVPRLPDLFNMHEKEGSLGSNITWQKSWHDVMKERRSTTVDFESVHQLQFIIHGSLKPSRILLHSLEGFGTISSIHVELSTWKYGSPMHNFHTSPPLIRDTGPFIPLLQRAWVRG